MPSWKCDVAVSARHVVLLQRMCTMVAYLADCISVSEPAAEVTRVRGCRGYLLTCTPHHVVFALARGCLFRLALRVRSAAARLSSNDSRQSRQLSEIPFDNCRKYLSTTVGNTFRQLSEIPFDNCRKYLSTPVGNTFRHLSEIPFDNCRKYLSTTVGNTFRH